MRAVVYSANGAARDVLRFVELPDPTPGPGEVRVRVKVSGVNPSDVKTRRGLRAQMAYPFVIPHNDGAGVIDAVGEGVSPSRVGERVWTWNAQWGRAFGTAAELVTLPTAQAVPLPHGVGFAEGAALGVPALTAYHAVAMDGGVAGKAVLVSGGAGSVGHYAIQLARAEGAALVIATVSSAAKAQLATQAGADVVINYKDEPLVERVRAATGGRGVDRIVEVDLAANIGVDLEMIAREGDIIPYGSGSPQIPVTFLSSILRMVRYRFFIVYNLTEPDRRRGIEALTTLMQEGRLTHNVARQVPFEDIVEAHELVEQGGVPGKVVLAVA